MAGAGDDPEEVWEGAGGSCQRANSRADGEGAFPSGPTGAALRGTRGAGLSGALTQQCARQRFVAAGRQQAPFPESAYAAVQPLPDPEADGDSHNGIARSRRLRMQLPRSFMVCRSAASNLRKLRRRWGSSVFLEPGREHDFGQMPQAHPSGPSRQTLGEWRVAPRFQAFP